MRRKSDTGFGFWSNPILAPVLILIWLAILILFRLMPEVDLAVSSFFYDSEFCAASKEGAICIGFPLATNPVFLWIRDILNVSPRYIGVALLLFLIVQFSEGKRLKHIDFRNQSVVMITLLLGPLLVVNLGFKEFFGRVRPRLIENFGGTLEFTKVGDVAGQCLSNCSFVSGEASTGGWFLCCGLLFSPAIRKHAYIGLFILGFSMAMLRVVFGAHFLSDALLGYLIPIIICALIALILDRTEKRHTSQQR